jgi:hypothetical protein
MAEAAGQSKNPRENLKRAHSVDLSENRTPTKKHQKPTFINLTSHGNFNSHPVPLKWGAKSAEERGPIVATNRSDDVRNAIGAHGGSYCVYRALAVATGKLDLVRVVLLLLLSVLSLPHIYLCFVIRLEGPLSKAEADSATF